MKRIAYSLCLGMAVFLLSSCTSLVELPVRPSAYVVPTVMPVSVIAQCRPCPEISSIGIERVLSEAHQLEYLKKAGFQEADSDVLARGLRRRGYAEIDARRSKGVLRWIVLVGCDDGKSVQVSSAYEKLPPSHVWPDESAVLRQAFNGDGKPGVFMVVKMVKISEAEQE